MAIAGTSAGGHLAALAGLTANDPELQGELPEGSDTSVDAVVGIYGRYDWEDKSTVERVRFVDFLERIVVKRKIDKHPDVFRKASPIARVHSDAPPFLVVHGTGDSVIPVAQARSFVDRLKAVSRSVVSYVELPGAGHGFDMTDGARTGSACDSNRLVPQPHSPKPEPHRGERGYIVTSGQEGGAVKRLRGWDAVLLYSETPSVHMHTLKLAVIELDDPAGAKFGVDELRKVIHSRLYKLDPFRYELIDIPFKFHHPMWRENAEVDLDYHVRSCRVDEPGGRRQLDEAVGRIASTPLDRSRPLWEMYSDRRAGRRPDRGARQDPPRARRWCRFGQPAGPRHGSARRSASRP